nr:HNH endonuclease [Longispora sp. (in: high G+C Gram-positive bacteria)]
VVSGTWTSPYDGLVLTSAENIDVDHMVPLANAWRTGAVDWDDKKRGDFANDMERPELFAVSRTSNRAKGDQDPSQWKPPERGYWCSYAKSWITVKSYWKLTVTEKEREALTDMLGTCR